MTEKIKDKVNLYYTDKANAHGATSMGVDWNGPESHHLRFTQLLKLLQQNEACTLLDFGCGYGELFVLINFGWPKAKYYGFDI
jgi:SAM-dependent methyltransferase